MVLGLGDISRGGEGGSIGGGDIWSSGMDGSENITR